jgi:hypothetical protein
MFNEPYYLNDMVSHDDMAQSRILLESVVSKAVSAKQKARAQYLLDAFKYYECSVHSYLAIVNGLMEAGKDIIYYQEMNKNRYVLIENFRNNPVLNHPSEFTKYKNFLIW